MKGFLPGLALLCQVTEDIIYPTAIVRKKLSSLDTHLLFSNEAMAMYLPQLNED